jgi:hypothetical protein
VTVPEPDKNLLNGGLDDIEGIPADQIWPTRHFKEESEGWYFAVYYLKMKRLLLERGVKDFLTLYQEHTGSDCSRNSLLRWCTMLVNLEAEAVEATAKKDFKALSSLKLGRQGSKKGK